MQRIGQIREHREKKLMKDTYRIEIGVTRFLMTPAKKQWLHNPISFFRRSLTWKIMCQV